MTVIWLLFTWHLRACMLKYLLHIKLYLCLLFSVASCGSDKKIFLGEIEWRLEDIITQTVLWRINDRVGSLLWSKHWCICIYCEIIFIRWTLNFMYFKGKVIYELNIATKYFKRWLYFLKLDIRKIKYLRTCPSSSSHEISCP